MKKILLICASIQVVFFLIFLCIPHEHCPPTGNAVLDNFILPVAATAYMVLVLIPIFDFLFGGSK